MPTRKPKPAKKPKPKPKAAAKPAAAPPEAPKPLTDAQLARVKKWWEDSIVKAVCEELETSEKLLTKIIELVPTSAQAHFSRSNVRKRRKDRKGQNADLKRSTELAELAEKHGWSKDVILVLKEERLNPTPVPQAAVADHTMTVAANYHASEVTIDELASAGLTVTATGPLRLVAGARTTKKGFEAVAFAETKRGRTWSAATPELVGKKAEKLVEKLAEKHKRFVDLFDAFDGTLDGFEEQEMYQADFD